MRIQLCAVGRLRAGPEQVLIDDYLSRFDRCGRNLGLGPVTVAEIDAKSGGTISDEARLLSRAIVNNSAICALDERGKQLTSPQFAKMLAGWRDAGRSDAAFVIGGADGLDPSLRELADAAISFGPMVWPHVLARVMVAEQLYRAASILAGLPYHRT